MHNHAPKFLIVYVEVPVTQERLVLKENLKNPVITRELLFVVSNRAATYLVCVPL